MPGRLHSEALSQSYVTGKLGLEKLWPQKGFEPLRMSASLNFNFIAMIIIALSIAGVFGLYASVLLKPGHDDIQMPG